MIRLIRKKIGLKFLELRYPENVVEEKGFDMVKIYSFRDFLADGWVKEKQCTMMISLDKQIEELWVNIKDKYRKHIATERNKGVIVKKITNEEKNNEQKMEIEQIIKENTLEKQENKPIEDKILEEKTNEMTEKEEIITEIPTTEVGKMEKEKENVESEINTILKDFEV